MRVQTLIISYATDLIGCAEAVTADAIKPAKRSVALTTGQVSVNGAALNDVRY